MDAYEREWRRIARSRSLDQIIRYHEFSRDEWWSRWNSENRLERYEYRVRQEERQRAREIRAKYAQSFEPVKNWVGACWIAPDGRVFAVEYGNHSERARHIVQHVLKRDPAELPTTPDDFISDKLRWIRVSESGQITDAWWNQLLEWTDEQGRVLAEMPLILAKGEAVCPPADPEFIDGLKGCLRFAERFANGEVDSNGFEIREHEEEASYV